MKLNLGCADRRIEGFTGVDITPGPCVDQVVDLEGPWPWPDSSVEEVKAHDVFEHIGEDPEDIGEESRAYLTEHIVKQIWAGIQMEKNKIERKQIGRAHV